MPVLLLTSQWHILLNDRNCLKFVKGRLKLQICKTFVAATKSILTLVAIFVAAISWLVSGTYH